MRPGALPAPYPHHAPPYSLLMKISSFCCKTGWLATHRERLPLAQGVCGPLAAFTGRGADPLKPVLGEKSAPRSCGSSSLAAGRSPEQFNVGVGWWAVGT